MIDFTATYTDQYELTMAQVYFLKGRVKDRAVFDYFFRKLPFEGGYAVFAGLEDLLDVLEELHFDGDDIAYLREQGLDPEFVKYLEGFRFAGDVYAAREGDLVFATRPVVRVEGNIIEAQIVETVLLNILNFQTLVATKASRMREVAGKKMLIDFGLRRAQGPGGYYASRAAIVGGFDATSNVRAGRDYGIAISGTMAHSLVESYDDELAAFRDFAEGRADDCVLLVDTYDTLRSGMPNAIRVGKEMESCGRRLKAVRLDSGDLAYLSKKAREMLDKAGLDYVKIAASNQLDEYVIKSLEDQHSPIDVFGVGTELATGRADAALDGIYKLAVAAGKPRIKFSESAAKVSLPGRKQVYRVLNEGGGFWGGDVVTLDDESDVGMMYHPFDPLKSVSIEGLETEALLHKVMEKGKRTVARRALKDIARYSREQLGRLGGEYKRFVNPHVYKVGLSGGLKELRDRLIDRHKGRIEQ